MDLRASIDRRPSRAKLRGLALVFAAVTASSATHASLVRGNAALALGIASAGTALVVATLVPLSGRVIYVAWMTLGVVLGRITAPIVLGLVYFGVVTPIALCARLTGRDRLRLRRRPEGDGYWEPVPRRRARRDYFRPF